ncbi:MAG: 2-aminoethylphosphonate--pyruvate transaminase [Acidimicrobiia bacterium]|nr:2-aminoethylphosphonate--pyruvate transaminase [Acidimicrobiia bacterium]
MLSARATSERESPVSVASDPYLLTPGPLTTSATTKKAMLHDWGSRDTRFIEMTARVRSRLLELISAGDDHVCVPIQGSGTFAIEATLGTLLSDDDKLLILLNGAYGRRMATICDYQGRDYQVIETAEDVPCDPDALERALIDDPETTHVAVVHCETTSGILNPIGAIAEVVSRHGRSLVIDAMSTFGALEINADNTPFDAVIASSNKCLEGVPGLGFAIIRRSTLEDCSGNAPSLSLDLYEQWRGLESNGQWRFTPPTHVIAALDQALDELDQEGGVSARGARYTDNCETLMSGMSELGFVSALDEADQAPIILTFLTPADPHFDFNEFYDHLSNHGFLIYPGKLTNADTFRVGCIGRLDTSDMQAALEVMRSALTEMGVTEGAPHPR